MLWKKIKLDRKTGNTRGRKATILQREIFHLKGYLKKMEERVIQIPRGEVYSEGGGSTKVWNLTFIISKYFYINA